MFILSQSSDDDDDDGDDDDDNAGGARQNYCPNEIGATTVSPDYHYENGENIWPNVYKYTRWGGGGHPLVYR